MGLGLFNRLKQASEAAYAGVTGDAITAQAKAIIALTGDDELGALFFNINTLFAQVLSKMDELISHDSFNLGSKKDLFNRFPRETFYSELATTSLMKNGLMSLYNILHILNYDLLSFNKMFKLHSAYTLLPKKDNVVTDVTGIVPIIKPLYEDLEFNLAHLLMIVKNARIAESIGFSLATHLQEILLLLENKKELIKKLNTTIKRYTMTEDDFISENIFVFPHAVLSREVLFFKIRESFKKQKISPHTMLDNLKTLDGANVKVQAYIDYFSSQVDEIDKKVSQASGQGVADYRAQIENAGLVIQVEKLMFESVQNYNTYYMQSSTEVDNLRQSILPGKSATPATPQSVTQGPPGKMPSRKRLRKEESEVESTLFPLKKRPRKNKPEIIHTEENEIISISP